MKRFSVTLLFITLFTPFYYSQSEWVNQNSGTNAILQNIYFTDENNGWVSGAGPILHTSDGGQTWAAQNTPALTGFYVDIFFTDPMNGWSCGNEARIIHTSDGGMTWNIQPNPYTAPVPILYGVYFVNPDTGWVVGGDHGTFPNYTNRRIILHTTNGGATWGFQLDASGLYPLYCVHFIDSDNGFAASEIGEIMSTSDGGDTWITKSPAGGRPYSIFFINSLTGWVSGEDVSASHYSTISKTTDGGNSWVTQSFNSEEYIQDINFVDEMTGWAVGGTIGGSGGNQHTTILHTTNGGENWISQNPPSTSTLLGVSFADANHGWAAGIDGTVLMYMNPVPVELTSFSASTKENNVTLNWQTSTETNNKGFEIQRSVSKDSFGEGRGQRSEWEDIGFVEGHGTTTQENNYAYVDKKLESGDYFYRLVQLDFDGTRNPLKEVSVEINSVPSQYSLSQNYPNPFNPSTSIEYSVAVNTEVNLTIYNTLGEKIKTLVNGNKAAGNYRVNFDARSLPSGIYYYRIKAGNYNSTKKMILLR